MLRPATPLTILLCISFVFLLLSVLSTPVIRAIPIATFAGVDFGVFGYCQPNNGCSGIRVGYTTDGLFGSAGDGDFNLPSSARHSLSALLIVHPVAAFCNLICLALAAAAHLHSPSHSARYLLGLLILLLPTLLVTLLAFLVDILLFVPHLQWGGWIVLASTILITASGVVTCAMRRTLVSRKARKKRIAENAEMSGENFYNRQAAQELKSAGQTFNPEPSMPMVNGAPGADRLPTFATFTSSKAEDDRQPLRTQAMSNENTLVASSSRDNASDRFYQPPSRSGSRPPRDGTADQQYGDPTAPVPIMGPGSVQRGLSGDERSIQGPYRDGSIPPPGARAYGSRGRGSYAPRPGYPSRGGAPAPRGPPVPQGYSSRGAFNPDMRGGYGGRGRGSFGPGMAAGALAGGAAGAMMANGQSRPPPGYLSHDGQAPDRYAPPEQYPDRMPADGPVDSQIAQSQPFVEDRNYTPMSPSIYTQGPDDHHGPYGARVHSPGRERMSPYGVRAQSPSSTTRRMSPPPAMPPVSSPQPAELSELPARALSPQRSQSQDQYVPPRTNWGGPGSPSRYDALPAEMPSGESHVAGYRDAAPARHRVNSGGSDIYYEDVDPRFAQDQPPLPVEEDPEDSRVPMLLTPGQQHQYRPEPLNLPPSHSYEDLPGARSPAESETSNFTSVSQRGVNPNWRPGNGGEFSSLGPMRRPPGARDQQQMRQDVLLQGNPDFALPGMTGPGRRARGGHSSTRGGYPGMGGGRIPPASAVPGVDGRYPMGGGPPGGPRGI
ncbi:hypothetical protein PV10_09132 [Exophiala mesophila]|uniref:PH-response regulator protein palI/RIM9 n=1 Tax=Exophiala mesophila TaxID=212818 RepID=A0A0D1WHC4_EXOME|nr:uncharacterized protein PV10_09132 [Exophiala mesophila]KIV88215.1 hypothetical protein PV10_09132 [Exophiala mesophila]